MKTNLKRALLCAGALALLPSTPLPANAAQTPLTASIAIQRATNANSLAWTEWELMSPKYSGTRQNPFLKFTDNRLSAGVGLNSIGGSYAVNGTKISLRNLFSTRMAGPPELMQAEDRYSKVLQEVQSFRISPDGQTLTLSGPQTLTFRLTGRTPQGFVPTETKIINVAPQLGPALDGDKTPRYLQLEDLSGDISWGRFTEAKIEGFQFVPGYRYQLRVVVERDSRTQQKRLRLLEVFSQQWMQNAPLAANHKILEVAPTRIDCSDTTPRQCLQVRETGGEWLTLRTPIIGFDYQPGWRYRLQVASANTAGSQYTLIRLLDKLPVTY